MWSVVTTGDMYKFRSIDTVLTVMSWELQCVYRLSLFRTSTYEVYGPGSSVGIATELRAGRSGDGIPVGWDFLPAQTGPEAHPASCTRGTSFFPGVKYGRGVLLTTYPLLVTWSWKSRAIPLSNLWATTGPVTGTLYLFTITLPCRMYKEI